MNFSVLNRFVAPTLFVFALATPTAHAQNPAPPASASGTEKSAPTTPQEKAQAEIQTRLDAHCAAAARKDIIGATRYYAPDFLSIASNGTKYNLTQLRAISQKSIDAVESVEITDTIDALTLKGNTATVDMTEMQKATVRQPSGITHTVNVQSRSRCFWTKTKTGWLMKRARVLQAGADLDGKPVQVANPD